MTNEQWAIGPYIGVARVGNSPEEFYIDPERAGALPIAACPATGNVERDEGGRYQRVRKFKDEAGRIKRQAARFRVFRKDGDHWRLPEQGEIEKIVWTVHLANKKACWFDFAELRGNLLYPDNSYTRHGHEVELRNSKVQHGARRSLIVDFGPRSVSQPGDRAHFDANSVPDRYVPRYPAAPRHGEHVTTLGEIRMNDANELLVLGGFGRAGGDQSIRSFAGADTWIDDISDGSVTCTLTIERRSVELYAWCIVGPPKFAPEIVNIVTLADTMEDVAIRWMRSRKDVFDKDRKGFNREYEADFELDIRPILERPSAYRWVANIPSLLSISPPPFDPRDNSDKTSSLRQAYFELFRKPNGDHEIDPTHGEVGAAGRFPMMPLNAGSNSVSNEGPIDKFMSLTQTQYFMLEQWARGRFRSPPVKDGIENPLTLTLASMGNCVGAPLCPGIEVTWTTRNPALYIAPFRIRHRHPTSWYFKRGLDPEHDETDPRVEAPGCEPGDLTKRMAIPWQADFFQCTAQYINFSEPKINESDGIPAPPTYYAYWWPPQSPWHVMTGDMSTERQAASGTPGGYQVIFTRGINTFAQMLEAWSYMGFIVNRTRGEHRGLFPNFAERERNHEKFVPMALSLGVATDVISGDNTNFSNAWILRPDSSAAKPPAVAFGTSRRHGRVPHDRS